MAIAPRVSVPFYSLPGEEVKTMASERSLCCALKHDFGQVVTTLHSTHVH